MTDSRELEDLDGLIQHPGWTRYKALFDAEWGAAGARFTTALDQMANDTDKVRAADNMQRVIWVRKEMTNFLRSVEQRVTELRHRAEPVATMSRRGVL